MEHDNRAAHDTSFDDGPQATSPSQASAVQPPIRRSSLAVGIRHASALEQPGAVRMAPAMRHDPHDDEAASSGQSLEDGHGHLCRRSTRMRSTECDMELPAHAERHVERHLARVSASFELNHQSMASMHGNDHHHQRDRNMSSPLPLDPMQVAEAVGPRPSNALRSRPFQALLFVQDNEVSRMAFR